MEKVSRGSWKVRFSHSAPEAMKTAIFLVCLVCIAASSACAGRPDAGTLLGTWIWHHVRHEILITYKGDGTYHRKSSTMATGGDVETDRGTWKLEGNNLVEISSAKESKPLSSVIKFESKDRFELDGFMTFDRVR
jgi:hypothetical protein